MPAAWQCHTHPLRNPTSPHPPWLASLSSSPPTTSVREGPEAFRRQKVVIDPLVGRRASRPPAIVGTATMASLGVIVQRGTHQIGPTAHDLRRASAPLAHSGLSDWRSHPAARKTLARHPKAVMSMRNVATDSDQLIDGFLPDWDFREEHSCRIDAPPSQVRAALLGITPRELPLGSLMMALRLAPAAIVARRWPRGLDRPWIELLLEFGFVGLADRDGEIVFGAVGKFWRLREEAVPLADAAAFVRFKEPGFAKGALNFWIADEGGTTRLTTETRVQATDKAAHRSFLPYWIPVRAIGGLMRREILRAVARRVQRSPENASDLQSPG
jgi:hypothetical protein